MTKLKQELANKEVQLQARVLIPPMDAPTAEPSYCDPMDTDIPLTGGDVVGTSGDSQVDYTTSAFSADAKKDLREKIQMEVDAIVKDCMHWENNIIHLACLSYLTPEEIYSDYHMPTLPFPLLKQEVILMKKILLPVGPTNELGGYANVSIQDHQVADIESQQPKWRVSRMKKNPRNKLHYLAAPQELRIDPTFFPIKRRCNWDTFQRIASRDKFTWLNYPELPEPKQGRALTERYMIDTLNGVIQQLKGIPDLSCVMMVKIAKMIITVITEFRGLEQTRHPWTRLFEGTHGLCWNLLKAPTRQVLMGLYARVIFLPSHYLVTFEEAFYTGFFEVQSDIFSLLNRNLRSRFVAFMHMEIEMPLKDVLADVELEQRIKIYQIALENLTFRRHGIALE